MQYRFDGNKLQLIKYEITAKNTMTGTGGAVIELTDTHTACTDSECDELLQRYPTATVTTVDNTGYEWLDGMQFTQEQLADGELERAVEMGENAYNEIKNAPSQDEINAMLMLQIAECRVKGRC
jgi:hypothetical protein